MANNSSKKNQNSARSSSKTAPKSADRSGFNTASEQKRELLDKPAKNDLIGVVIEIIAAVLLVIVLIPAEAIGAKFISSGIRLILGIGAIILPFLLAAWGVTFFIRQRLKSEPKRLIIGLLIIYLAVISLAASFIYGAAENPQIIFLPDNASAGGGYLGGVFAWLLLSSIGLLATRIIFIGLILVGLILVGFSVSRLIESVISRIARKKNSNTQESGQTAAANSAYQMGPVIPLSPDSGKGNRNNGRGSKGLWDKANNIPLTDLMGDSDDDSDNLYAGAYKHGAQGVLPLDATADLGATRRNRYAQGTETPIAADMLDGDGSCAANGKATSLSAGRKTKSHNSDSGTGDKTAGFDHNYVLPNANLLRVSREKSVTKAGTSELRATAARLQATFEEFGVEGQVIGWISGPTVTLYKVTLGEGVRLNRITNLQNDIQLSLAAEAIRIVAPIPGTSLVGVEVPNATRNMVLLGDVLNNAQLGPLQLAIGKDVEGDSIAADLATMPHLLIGGTTGSGKSVAINAMIMSILMRATPDEVRMILIDPKMVELSLYNGIPHLYVPVVTDAHQAAAALNWAVAEMERRLKIFGKHGVKNIKQFNARVNETTAKNAAANMTDSTPSSTTMTDTANTADNPELSVKTNLAKEQDALQAIIPYIVIVIDELADLMMVAGKDVETSISRLAQLARAAGLHLIVATQRPSSTVITGLIKANIVNRIAFTVATGIDSRVILDVNGAEDLIGLGDLLFSRPEYSKPVRIQGCLVSEPEIETVVDFWRSQGEPEYNESILELKSAAGNSGSEESYGEDDPLLWEAAEIVVSTGLGSTSTLQRRLKVGYARAGRIMDMLEGKGIVGPPNGSKPREVIIDDILDLEALKSYER